MYRHCPKAKIILLRTWGYKNGSATLASAGYENNRQMFEDAKKAYGEAAERIGAFMTIPLGDAVAVAAERGVESLFRDDIHMSHTFGRYLLGLTFFTCLTGRPIMENSFCDLDKPMSDEEFALAKEIAESFRRK